jgi:hypothetical protein
MTSMSSHHTSPGSITSQFFGEDRHGEVIDLAQPTGPAGPKRTGDRPWRPGEHRLESEAALRFFEYAGGEEPLDWYAWGCAVEHALLAIAERL